MTASPLLPLATETWDAEELAAIDRVVASRRFTMGPEVRAFETQFAAHFGARHAVMVNSGSSANLIALAGALYHPKKPFEPGDQIIVPAVSWSTTFYPVHQLGLELRFVDVDAETLNMRVADVEAAITNRTRGVLAVNLLGNPCDLNGLRTLCDARGLTLIEDNCESMGARVDGRDAGTWGLAGTFSTFFSHHISTMEGGVIVTDDTALYNTMVSLRAHGWLREQPADSHLNIEVDDFVRLFRFVLPGYNVRPLEMSGAIGQAQLRKLPALVAARRANAVHFQRLFADCEDIQIQRETGESSWFGFAMVLRGRLAGRRAELVAALREAGVEARPIVAGNFTLNPVLKHLRHAVPGPLPNADRIDAEGLFIGNHHFDIAEALARCREIVETVAQRR